MQSTPWHRPNLSRSISLKMFVTAVVAPVQSSILIAFSCFSLSVTITVQDFYWTLSFSITFVHASDTVYLAHFYPYTYSHLRWFLGDCEKRSRNLIRQPLTYRQIRGSCCNDDACLLIVVYEPRTPPRELTQLMFMLPFLQPRWKFGGAVDNHGSERSTGGY